MMNKIRQKISWALKGSHRIYVKSKYLTKRVSFPAASKIIEVRIYLIGRISKPLSLRSIGSLLGILALLFIAWWTIGPKSYPGDGGLNNLWQFLLVLVVGMAISLPVIILPRERYVKLFSEHFGWIPVVLGAFSYPYWYWYSADQVDVGFFQTAAQVLPVLLLAGIIDIRRSSTLKTPQLALPLIAVSLGEIAALNESAFYESAAQVGRGRADFAVVASSLVVSIVALIMAVMANLEDDEIK